MSSDNSQIEIIEQYLLGNLSAPEREAFEAQMSAEPALSAEVAAYRQVLEGFGSMQMSDFSSAMQEWDQEWASIDQEEAELIEWYLSGQLSGNALQQLELRIQRDEAFANKLNQYRTIFNSLGALQMSEFADNMQDWNKEETAPKAEDKGEAKVVGMRPIFRRLAIAASVLILLFAGANWYAEANYSDEQIITGLYESTRSQNVMGDNQGIEREIDQKYQEAHQQFQRGDYDNALLSFDQLLQEIPASELDDFTANYYRENIEWNRVLAQIGANSSDAEVQASLDAIKAKDGHSYQDEAMALEAKLNSFWKRLAN
jgi:anti-sigma-K factor RskA